MSKYFARLRSRRGTYGAVVTAAIIAAVGAKLATPATTDPCDEVRFNRRRYGCSARYWPVAVLPCAACAISGTMNLEFWP